MSERFLDAKLEHSFPELPGSLDAKVLGLCGNDNISRKIGPAFGNALGFLLGDR